MRALENIPAGGGMGRRIERGDEFDAPAGLVKQYLAWQWAEEVEAKADKPKAEEPKQEAAEYDDKDLTQITGIGEVKAKQLHKAGIKTVTDMAKVADKDVEALSDKVDVAGVDRVKKWRRHAREIVAAGKGNG
jgi:predicted flap endonuclease-1-like 5' DNA nuclease